MKEHNKLLLAGEMLLEAAKECRTAKTDVQFVKSILLAGAVSMIVTPILQELDIESLHENLAKRAAEFGGIDLSKLSDKELTKVVGRGLSFYRSTYNSLKHTGFYDKIKPSDDVIFTADLEYEAYLLIDAAIIDFNKIPFSREVINFKLSDELLDLLNSPWNFPANN